MPLSFTHAENEFQLAVWKMDEQLEELMAEPLLSAPDLVQLNSFTHVARKKEWICVRLLLKQLGYSVPIRYLPSGKPYIENPDYHISISHTREYAGLMISKRKNVGIDLERIHPRIEKIAHKFVSANEEKFVGGTRHIEKLFVIWGAKEVLFKMHSIGELIFKEHLDVHRFEFKDSGQVTATVSKPGFQKDYTLNYLLRGDLLITYCSD